MAAAVTQAEAHCSLLQPQATWLPVPPARASAAVAVLAGHCTCSSMPAANAKGFTMSDSPGAVTAAAAAGSALGLLGSSAVQTAAMSMCVLCGRVQPCMNQCVTCHLQPRH